MTDIQVTVSFRTASAWVTHCRPITAGPARVQLEAVRTWRLGPRCAVCPGVAGTPPGRSAAGERLASGCSGVGRRVSPPLGFTRRAVQVPEHGDTACIEHSPEHNRAHDYST
jgi:hypothetical protein